MSKDIIFADFETTDLLKSKNTSLDLQPHITEICFIRTSQKLKIKQTLISYVCSDSIISVGAWKRTGITREMLYGKPYFSELAKRIKDIMKGASRFVAHNARFDHDVLQIEFARLKMKTSFFPEEIFCTVEESMHILGMRLTLQELHVLSTGKEFDNAHKAESDVLAMIECYKYITNKKSIPKNLKVK